MQNILRRALALISTPIGRLAALERKVDDLKILIGRAVAELIASRAESNSIRDAEFKVFSQFGEDGIIQYLIRRVGVPPQACSFVEFGVESYEEANTIFLLENNNWRGLIIDGSEEKIRVAQSKPGYWRHNLIARVAFIDRENINTIIREAGFEGQIGLLSVDIDGNDYWVWESVHVVNPIIVICEYNSVFGKDCAISIPYNPQFTRTQAHCSNLYWGCSLKALEYLADKKGYALVGSNSAGNNAFFVRRDCLQTLKPVTAEEAWVDSQFRESRGQDGRLTYLQGPSRLAEIRELPVVNVVSGQTALLKDL